LLAGMSMLRKRLVLPVACALIAAPAAAQEPAPLSGRAIYELVAESVFLVQTERENGDALWQGTAFLIGNDRLITNAHVISEGKVFLKSAGVKIRCNVEARDELNDLALLTVPGVGASRPLRLASALPKPGEAVFAIGNPQGLERTISHGLYTGPRSVEGRDLLLVSASISQGSSGGPIVNSTGEVVGVAASFLTEGQNLNFAVPLAAIRALVSGDRSSAHSIESLLAFVRRLQQERKQTGYSADPGSAYQLLNRRISHVLSEALIAADNKPGSLVVLAEAANFENTSIALQAAEQAVDMTKGADPHGRIALARALRAKSWSNEKDREPLLRLAEKHAAVAIKALHPPLAEHMALLAGIQEDLPDKLDDAYRTYTRALELRRRSDPDTAFEDLFHLFDVARKLSRPEEARSWFAELTQTGKTMRWHYVSYARFLHDAGDYSAAGDTYILAAKASGGEFDDWCRAARSFWTGENLDRALATARQCIEAGAVTKDSDEGVAYAHRAMSLILVNRGVYDEAISHAKQAIAIDAKDGWAYYSLARSLRSLNRDDEAIAAAKHALRVTDGKHAIMHSVLGAAYFGSGHWPQAASAYRKAAEMEPTDAGAAYNVAAALYNEKSYRESLPWWEEVLRRDPKYPERTHVLETIQEIRRISTIQQ
jgi:tetratricopeptide (TPR) repeat protein